MADVLIEGIRLPDYGAVMVELQAGGNVRYVDAYGEFKYTKATTISAHGDLIDRDAFVKFIKENWPIYDQWIVGVLDARPTVIPAEKEKV